MKRLLTAGLLLAGTALTASAASAAEPSLSLAFIGAATVSDDLTVDGTLVGGLSGIDFDAASGSFIAISDDRSDHAPARFYSLHLAFTNDRLMAATIDHATSFLQEDGQPYPNGTAGGTVPDPESIRLDPQDGNLWWTSEGDRTRGINPFVRQVTPDGAWVGEMPVPSMFDMNADAEIGPRNNLAFEGLSFAPDGNTLWVSLEQPLYEDGPQPTPTAGTVTRITHYDRDGTVVGQYAYPLDPVQATPGGTGTGDNGVSDILALDDTHLLAIERSGVPDANNIYKDYIRIYEIDTSGATDVSDIDALAGATYQPVTKSLVLNLDDAAIGYVDNIEGISWGPTLSDGNRSLVLVSDNNFNDAEITQFLAFEVTE